MHLGAKGWGNNSWNLFALDEIANVMGPTGVSSTGSVGTLGLQIDATFSLTGVSATSSVGSVDAADVIKTNRSICNFFCRINNNRIYL